MNEKPASDKDWTLRDRPESEEFYTILGKFIHRFSTTESLVATAVVTLSGLGWKAGMAMFGNYRINEAKAALKTLIEAKSLKSHPRFDDALAQLGHIADARNLIVHFPVQFRNTGPTAQTGFGAKVQRQVLVDEVSVTKMMEDLSTINVIVSQTELIALSHPWAHSNEPPHTFVQKLAEKPWQYKPPSQSRPKSKPPRPASLQVAQPPPPSSQK